MKNKKCWVRSNNCKNKKCRYWIDFPEDNCCALIAVKKNGPMNLREIAERENISYARVKQIQDAALIKLRKRGVNLVDFLYK
jgi:RNA polymerase-interacting CarD/CdnL/TRCF family regulator